MKLDMSFVRQQFPQANDEFVFCSNAGGSYVATQVLDIFEDFNRYKRIQPYAAFSPSKEGGQLMDRARNLWARALNIDESELTIGPSTSANSYVMANAIAQTLEPGDEVVVCQQDHEANHGVWRRMAELREADIREWPVDPETGLLNPEELYNLLTDKTRWVFFTHCSNLVGTTNPVKEIVAGVRARSSALVGVDGVAYAPHHIPDLKTLDCDLYLFSLYKVYGPHQGILYVRESVSEKLMAQSHYFLAYDPRKRFNPTGPQHAEVAASGGVLDYFCALMDHHGIEVGDSLSSALHALHKLLSAHEVSLATPIVEYLDHSSEAQLLGKSRCDEGDRAPTISFRPVNRTARAVTSAMNKLGVGAENGDFYAERVLQGMGIDPQDGVVRVSLVHYNTEDEALKIVKALDQSLLGRV